MTTIKPLPPENPLSIPIFYTKLEGDRYRVAVGSTVLGTVERRRSTFRGRGCWRWFIQADPAGPAADMLSIPGKTRERAARWLVLEWHRNATIQAKKEDNAHA